MQCFSFIKWDSREQLVSIKPRKSSAQHSSDHWAQHICSTHLIHHIISFSPLTTIPKLHYVGKFQRMHEVEYGLKISACRPSSGNVSFFSLLRYVRSRRACRGQESPHPECEILYDLSTGLIQTSPVHCSFSAVGGVPRYLKR
jgi:hypothetical protein